MKHFIVLTHDEVQNNIPYALVCETMYGCRWNNGSCIRKFVNEFTREEQKAISKMKKQSYEWYLVKGVPDQVKMTLETYNLWFRLADFCMAI
jgi:hypothetical protein